MKPILQYIERIIQYILKGLAIVFDFKGIIEHVAMILFALACIVVSIRYTQCSNDKNKGVFVPKDSSFATVIKSTYRPPSTPFEKHSKPIVKLPKDVSENNISRVIKVTPNSIHNATISIIETKDGCIYIDTMETKKVEMISYEEPILRFGSFFSAGVSMSTLQGFHILPEIAFSPLQICGVVQFPLLALDTQGAAVGIADRRDVFSIGLLLHRSFTCDQQLKLSLTYNF